MKSYAELYEAAQKTKNIRQLTAEYRKFEKKDDFVLGKLVGVSPVQSALGGGEYNQYLFETDEGLAKFALGRSGDGEIGVVFEKGKVYRVTFLGQENISGGRRVNKFDCLEIGFGDDIISDSGKGEKSG